MVIWPSKPSDDDPLSWAAYYSQRATRWMLLSCVCIVAIIIMQAVALVLS